MKQKIFLALSLGTVLPLNAANFYWDGSGGTPASWATASHWSTVETGDTPDPAVAPGEGDDVVFNTAALDADVVVTTGVGIGARSLSFNNTGVTTVRSSSSTARTFLLGEGGITVAADAGAANLGGSSNTLALRLQADQTWMNHSDSTSGSALRLHNAVAGPAAGTTGVTLTISNTSTGGTNFSNALNDGPGGGSVKLVVNSTGSGAVTMNGGSYSGGLSVQRGLVVVNSAAIAGTGSATLEAVTGGVSTLRVNHAGAVANNVIAGGAGTNVLEFTSTSGTLNGNVTLNHNLSLGVRSAGASGLTINGDITGSGDLIKGQYQGGNSAALTLAANVTTTGSVLVNNGVLTLADTSVLTLRIGDDGVNNKVGGSGTLNLNGTLVFDLTAAAAEDGNSWLVVDAGVENYGTGFLVQGFTQSGTNWMAGGYTFSQSTGLLSYAVPEPSCALLLIVGATASLRRKRKGA